MSFDQKSLNQMSLDQKSLYNIPLDLMFCDQKMSFCGINFDQMTICKMTIQPKTFLTFDEMTFHE